MDLNESAVPTVSGLATIFCRKHGYTGASAARVFSNLTRVPREARYPPTHVDYLQITFWSPSLYCHLASNPIVNAASRRLSTRPDDLTQVLVQSPTWLNPATTTKTPSKDPVKRKPIHSNSLSASIFKTHHLAAKGGEQNGKHPKQNTTDPLTAVPVRTFGLSDLRQGSY